MPRYKYGAVVWGGSQYKVLDVVGEPVSIPGYERFEFFVYQKESTRSWSVTEVESGSSIAYGPTKKEAIAEAERRLSHVTPEQLAVRIQKMIDSSGKKGYRSDQPIKRKVTPRPPARFKVIKANVVKKDDGEEYKGYLIQLDGYEEFDWFLYTGRGRGWQVAEFHTLRRVSGYDWKKGANRTQAEAVDSALANLDRYVKENSRQKLQDLVKSQGGKVRSFGANRWITLDNGVRLLVKPDGTIVGGQCPQSWQGQNLRNEPWKGRK